MIGLVKTRNIAKSSGYYYYYTFPSIFTVEINPFQSVLVGTRVKTLPAFIRNYFIQLRMKVKQLTVVSITKGEQNSGQHLMRLSGTIRFSVISSFTQI